MIFFLNLLAILFLYFQRYFNNGVFWRALPPKNFADYFYVVELTIFVVAYLFSKRKTSKRLALLAFAEVAFILAAETGRRSGFLSEQYLLGYPLAKGLIAASYSAVFLVSLFITIYFAARPFIGKYSFSRAASAEFIVVAALFFAGVYLNLSYSDSPELYSTKYDYAVVLGAAVNGNKPFPILRMRIEKARELYSEKIVSKILLTGAAAPGEESEAEVSRKYLLRKGVPSAALEYEEKTTTTFEQIKFLKRFSEGRKVSFVIVSDKFHLRRVRAMSDFLGLEAETASSGKNLRYEKKIYFTARDSLALLLFLFFAI